MTLFFHDLVRHDFLIYAVVGAALASVACGIVGSLVVAKRTTYLAGAIAHSVLGGMGAALYFKRVHGIEWLTPLTGAVTAAVIAALIISFVTVSGKQREDTVISAVWAIGMAVGISFISATPGYYEDLMSYLFGNILMIGTGDLWHMAFLDAAVLAVTILFYDRFLVVSFQPELAALRGLNIYFYHTLMILMMSLTVVLLTQIVGLIMVIALLALPAATAFKFVNRLWSAMFAAGFICMIVSFLGLAVSYEPELPAGATIIEIAGLIYILSLIGKNIYLKFFRKRDTSLNS
jgi:zinc transport system permease protein